MPGIANWKISPETRARFMAILDEAPRLGIDRDQAIAAGLPGLRALIGLKKAAEAQRVKTRDLALAETRAALRGVARRNPRLASQFGARILAMQGRGNDTEVAHVARGEMVVPQALQNAEVVTALRRAAAAHGVPVEMLLVGNSRNRINPETGAAEFGIMDWINRQFITGRDRVDEDPDVHGAAEGYIARTAEVGVDSANKRAEYARQVDRLDRFDNAGRDALKPPFREISRPEVRTFIKDIPLGPNPNSVGRANVTNPTINSLARGLGTASRGLGGFGVGLALNDIAHAENQARASIANAGAIAGGWLGGAGGALIPVVSPATAIAGSLAGGALGYRLGEGMYDIFSDPHYDLDAREVRRMGGR